MTNHPPILRYSALALPLAVGPAFTVSVQHGVGATCSAVLLLVNFWVLSALGPRVVAGFAREEGDPFMALWLSALVAKLLLLVGAFLWMVRVFPPPAVAVGFLPILLGTLGAAVQLAREAELAQSEV
jgi:uncharacterized membrane protein